jgi:LysR family hca operon transcriptional activator
VFLDHARLALLQVEAAAEAARHAERPTRSVFVVGFLIGQEVAWLPETLRILREEAPDIEVMISSQSSPELASELVMGYHKSNLSPVLERFLARTDELIDRVSG